MRLILPLLLTLLAPATAAKGPPDFPPPPEAKVELVARDMALNGQPIQARSFYTRLDPEKVARFYRKEWREGERGGPGYVETDVMAPWRLITRVEDGYLMTVQFQRADRGGTWGYLALSPLPDPEAKPPRPGEGVPAIRGSQVISDVASRDSGQSGRTVLLVNSHSLASNVNFYRHHFAHGGWQSEDDVEVAEGHTHLLSYKKWRRSVKIVISAGKGRSHVVVNSVTHD
ncbi:MAG: hypothetical protein D6786_05075, partial [Gammaproteobacteria bacterium]